MSLVVFLFGATILYFVYLVYTTVPAGTDPQTAGQALAKDLGFALGAIVLSGLFLAGLVLAACQNLLFRLHDRQRAEIPETQRQVTSS